MEEVGISRRLDRIDLLSADNSPLSDAEPHYLLPWHILAYPAMLNVVYVRYIGILISNLYPIYF